MSLSVSVCVCIVWRICPAFKDITFAIESPLNIEITFVVTVVVILIVVNLLRKAIQVISIHLLANVNYVTNCSS